MADLIQSVNGKWEVYSDGSGNLAGTLLPSGGIKFIDKTTINSSQLYDTVGAPTVNWDLEYLTDAVGVQVLNWSGHKLSTINGLTIDWENRLLTGGAWSASDVIVSGSSVVTRGQTGQFAPAALTGNFVTTNQTGAYASASQTGSFITTGQTGAFAAANQVVYTTGNQTISGNKTFAASILADTIQGITSANVVHVGSSILYDTGLITALNWSLRRGYTSGGTLTLDWHNRLLTGGVWDSQGLSVSGALVLTTLNTGGFADATKTGIFITTGQTGQFAQAALTGIFLTTGQSGAFAPAALTGSFITTGLTGNFVGISTTGTLFYPRQTNPSGYLVSSQTGSFIAANQTGAFYPKVGNPSGFVRFSDYISFNSFTFTYLHWPEISNILYKGSERFSITQSGFSGFSAASLFDGVYDTVGATIATGATGFLNIDFSGFDINNMTYPQGYVYLNFYNGLNPVAVSGRTRHAGGAYVNIVSSTPLQNGALWRLQIGATNNLNLLEITIYADTGVTTSLGEIEYFHFRPLTSEAPFALLNKTTDSTLYNNFTFNNSNRVAQVKINRTGSIIVGDPTSGTYNSNVMLLRTDQTSTLSFRSGAAPKAYITNDVVLGNLSHYAANAFSWAPIGSVDIMQLSSTSGLRVSGNQVVTTNQTGQFYPMTGNPSGFLTTGGGGNVVTTGQTGAFAAANRTVYTTGDQTISGNKIFSGSVFASQILGDVVTNSINFNNGVLTGTAWAAQDFLVSGSNVITRSQTGQFYAASNPSSYATTTQAFFLGPNSTHNTSFSVYDSVNAVTLINIDPTVDFWMRGYRFGSRVSWIDMIGDNSPVDVPYLSGFEIKAKNVWATGQLSGSSLFVNGVQITGNGGAGATNPDIVYTTGNQSIGGNKIFQNAITVSGNVVTPSVLGSGNVGVDLLNGNMFDGSLVTRMNWLSRSLSGSWDSQGMAVSGNPVVTTNQTGAFITTGYTGNAKLSGFQTFGWTGAATRQFTISSGTLNKKLNVDDQGLWWTRESDGAEVAYINRDTGATGPSAVAIGYNGNGGHYFKVGSVNYAVIAPSVSTVDANGIFTISNLGGVRSIDGVANVDIRLSSDGAAGAVTGVKINRTARSTSAGNAIATFSYIDTGKAYITTSGDMFVSGNYFASGRRVVTGSNNSDGQIISGYSISGGNIDVTGNIYVKGIPVNTGTVTAVVNLTTGQWFLTGQTGFLTGNWTPVLTGQVTSGTWLVNGQVTFVMGQDEQAFRLYTRLRAGGGTTIIGAYDRYSNFDGMSGMKTMNMSALYVTNSTQTISMDCLFYDPIDISGYAVSQAQYYSFADGDINQITGVSGKLTSLSVVKLG